MYIRLILEHSPVVWAPHAKYNIKKVEVVQRYVARFVTSDNSYTSSVTAVMEDLNCIPGEIYIFWPIMFYKIFHNLVDILYSNLSSLQPIQITQGIIISFDILSTYQKSQCIQAQFFLATINLWNELPSHIANAPTMNIFAICFI